MTWQLLLTIFLFLNAISYIYRRKLAVQFPEHNRLINAFFYLFILYPIGLIVAIIGNPNLDIGWFNLLILLAGGLLFPLGSVLAYRANENMDAGLYTILTNLIPIITIITAWWWLNETLNNRQLIGATIVLVSTFLITSPFLDHHRKNKTSGLAAAMAAIIIIGLAVTYERYMLTRVDFGAYLVFGWGAQVLWVSLFAIRQWPNLKLMRQPSFAKPVLVYGLSNALKGICFVSALKLSGNASLVSAFSSFVTVLVVFAAYFYLKEKDWLWLKLSAAAIGIGGMIILNT